MKLRRLSVRDFRGIESADVEPAAHGVTIVEGPNEIGKTSLGDALDILLEFKDSSRSQKIRDAQPVDRDVAPVISAELETGNVRFRYTKQFLKKSRTELDILAPNREQLRGDEAHERVLSLLAEHVDVGLWRALRMAQTGAIGQVQLDGQNVLSAALDCAAGSTIGDSAQYESLYAAVFAETQSYFTRTFKAGRDITALQGELEKERAIVSALEDQERDIDSDVERMQRLDNELTALRAELPELEADLRALNDTAERAKHALAARTAADEALRSFATEVQQLERQAAQHRQLLSERTQLADTIAVLSTEVDATAADESVLTSAADAARQALDNAQHDATAASAHEERLQQGAAMARHSEQLNELERRLARIVETDAALAAVRRTLADNPVTAERVDEAARAGAEQHAIARRLDEAAPILSIDATTDLVVRRPDGDEALSAGQSLQLEMPTGRRVVLVDIADLSVTAGTASAELQAKERQAADRYARILATMRVPSLQAARVALTERQRQEATLETAPAEIERLLGNDDRASLEANIAALRQRCAGSADPHSPPPSADELDAAAARRTQTETTLGHARTEAERAAERLLQRKHQADRLRIERDTRREHLAQLDLQLAAHDAPGDATTRESPLDAKRQQLVQLRDTARAASIEADRFDPATIKTRQDAARAAVQSTRASVQAHELELATLGGRLDVTSDVGLYEKIAAARAKSAALERRLDAMTRRAAAAKRLYDAMSVARQAQRQSYIAPMKSALEQLGRIVYGRNFDVELDETLAIVRRTLNGRTVDYARLSTGAKEQMAVLVRLAVARLVDPTDGVPVILDDVLGHSDPDRLKAMNAVLGAAGERCQIIVLTCFPDRYRFAPREKTLRLG